MENRYAVGDCIKLRKFVESHNWKSSMNVLQKSDFLNSFDLEVLNPLRGALQATEEADDAANDLLKGWIESIGDPGRSKVVDFVFKIPLEDVPLHVNDEALEPFVRWRLFIAR